VIEETKDESGQQENWDREWLGVGVLVIAGCEGGRSRVKSRENQGEMGMRVVRTSVLEWLVVLMILQNVLKGAVRW
jgi:hypothetical protein